MSNVKFNYLYRDGSNYKKRGELAFCNPDDLLPELITKQFRQCFLEDGLFVAHQVRIPEVFLAADGPLTEDDHCFHEFDEVETTSDIPDDWWGRSISEFLTEVAREAKCGWRAFDPRERLSVGGR